MAEEGEGTESKVNEWQVAWFKAIARAWADPAFKERLLHDPREALKEKPINFNLPPNVVLAISEVDQARFSYDPATQGWRGDLPLTLSLPPAPKNVADQAVALLQVGGHYPSHQRCCGNPCCH
jgi:ribosomally synthesized peptide (two-chain TOMM family)